jgi:4-hydroxy-tetrahydrodipicolinate reductase
MSEQYRVIIWGPGSIGGYTLRHALQRPELEVVGVRVYSPSKDGVDIGELAGIGPVGVAATTDVDALVALDADCVIHTPQAFDPNVMDAEVIRLLESGKNVVSTAGYHFPPAMGEGRAEALEAACRRGGTTIMGAGLHPPYAVTALAIPLTGAMTEVERIELVEAADLGRVLDDMGAATNPLVAALGFG